MYRPVTIKDIAIALNLSPSTVSRALRDGYEISTATKKLVLDYASKVNYQLNPIALSLKKGRSYSIGIVVPEVANSFFSQAIAGIESIAYERGYHTIITQTHDSPEREFMNTSHLAKRSVDGLLISMSSGTTDYTFLKKLQDEGLPIVFFDRVISEPETFKVTSDNFGGAFKATESLIRSGSKKIAFLANAPHLSITAERLSGYRKALKDHNILFRPELVKNCMSGGNDHQEVEDVVNELFTMSEKPDAIFIGSDRISISCIRALNKLDFNTRKIRIAGFSNSDVIDLLYPSIFYVKQKSFEMGRVAIEMLLRLIEGKHPPTEFEKIVLETELHIS